MQNEPMLNQFSEIRTSDKEWLERLAHFYKEHRMVRIVNDAGLPINPDNAALTSNGTREQAQQDSMVWGGHVARDWRIRGISDCRRDRGSRTNKQTWPAGCVRSLACCWRSVYGCAASDKCETTECLGIHPRIRDPMGGLTSQTRADRRHGS